MSDGRVVVDEERAAKKAKVAMTNSLDGRMLAVLDAVMAKTAVSGEQRKAQLAETVLVEQLRHYILFHGHCLEAFLYEAFINTSSGAPPPKLVDAIQDVGGLDALISTYCNSKRPWRNLEFRNCIPISCICARTSGAKKRRNSSQTRAGKTRRKELVKPLETAMSQISAEVSQLQISAPPSPEAAPAPAADADVIMEE
jgi:hypothetical protein